MIPQFRKVKKTDFKALSALIYSFYEEIPSEKPIDLDKIRKTFEELLSIPEKGTIYVIEVQNAIIGYAILINYWSNEYGGNLLFLDEVYIDQRYRNRGIGRKLIRLIIEQYKASSKTLQLEVAPPNLGAQKFYEKFGFKYLENKIMILEF